MFIDSDIVFHPDDVDSLRSHNLPFVCGIYPKKGPRQFACEFLPGTTTVKFGKHGGLTEVRYCGFGFTLVRREVFETVGSRLELPECNQRFRSPLVPYFQPMIVPEGEGSWSLAEDYSFCERCRRSGFAIVADTTIRLWHVGTYRYIWEDAGSTNERYSKYVFHLQGEPEALATETGGTVAHASGSPESSGTVADASGSSAGDAGPSVRTPPPQIS